MLAESFDVIAPLDVMTKRLGRVAASEELPALIEVDPPRIAASFSEQLELSSHRVITPDTLLELDAVDVGRHRAPLSSIQPAVRPPCQRVDQRMRILKAEPLQTPPCPSASPVARFSPATKSFERSTLPSPSVSSRIVIRSAPGVPRGGGSGTRSYFVRRY